MANYDDQLIPCTLNGLDLPLLSFTSTHARALAVHSYLDVPGGDLDDKGTQPLVVELEAAIDGLFAHQNLRALVGLIESTPPPLVLTHPVYGPMPIGVHECRARWEAGKRRHVVTLRVTRDTPTVAMTVTAPIVWEIPARPTLTALAFDYSALAAIAALWLSFLNAARSSFLSVLNAIASVGLITNLVTDIAVSEIANFGELLNDVLGTVFGGLKSVSDFPDEVAAALDHKLEDFEFEIAYVFDEPLESLKDYRLGEEDFDAGRFATGRLDDGGPTEEQHAMLAAYTGLLAAAAAQMTELVITAIKDAESAETLTAAQAQRAVTIVHRRLLQAHRLARQVLPGGRTAAALAKAAADLLRFYRGLKLRAQMREVVALETAPLFLVMSRYGIRPDRIAEVMRANDLADVLEVPVGTKVWLPVEAAA